MKEETKNKPALITFGQAVDAVAMGKNVQVTWAGSCDDWVPLIKSNGLTCEIARERKFRFAPPPVDPYAELKAAHEEGKVIQVGSDEDGWTDIVPNGAWRSAPSDYRIKPEPKFRPWETVEEVPVGRIAKNKTNDFRASVVGAFGDSSGPMVLWGAATVSAKQMFYQRTMDDGSPCGVEVKQ